MSVSHHTDHLIGDKFVSPSVGDRLEEFWPLDNPFYPSVIHPVNGEHHTILYNDEEKETVQLEDEMYSVLHASSASFSILQLSSNAREVLFFMLNSSGKKPILRHHAQGFDHSVILRA